MRAWSMVVLLAPLLLGARCEGGGDTEDTDDTEEGGNPPDGDEDGYIASIDCDDDNDLVFPDAPEVCNGRDDDCDGRTDEDAVDVRTWYLDADGDGFGTDVVVGTACNPPPNSTIDDTDCDDTLDSVHPGADERCNGRDDDCDPFTPEDASDDAVEWFEDVDGDGFGDAGTPTTACARPEGFVDDATDCDDARDEVHPGAEEVCNDGRDDDCDPTTDEEVVAGQVWYLDVDQDGSAGSDSVRSCTRPEGGRSVADDCADDDADIHPGVPETCNDGVDDDCNPETDEDELAGTLYYMDTDTDGFGDPNAAVWRCEAAGALVANADDCDDDAALVFPGAPEQCNDRDDDCDPLTLEDQGPQAQTWWSDLDRDGHAAVGATISTTACEAPDQFAAVRDDCDDALTDVHPGAPELCNDGRDDDCDPLTDEDVVSGTTWYVDGDGDDYGVAGGSVGGCTAPDPTGWASADGDCADDDDAVHPTAEELCNGKDDDCDGDKDDGCEILHCGNVTSDQTWAVGFTHVVTCDVEVAGPLRPTLTIEDGATVAFVAGAGLTVGSTADGDLQVTGAVSGVTFTSWEDDPLPGAWDGLRFGSRDQGSRVEGAVIELGGDGTAGVTITGSTVTFVDSEIRHSLGHGVAVRGSGTVALTSTTVRDNVDRGVDLDAGGRLGTFAANTFSGNGGHPVSLPVAEVGRLDAASSYVGNDVDRVRILAGTLAATSTWRALDVPYEVVGDVYVQGTARPKLTLEGGAELWFAPDAGLYVGWSGQGSLDAQGGAAPVVMTGTGTGPGAWEGISVGASDQGTRLEGLALSDAGSNGVAGLRTSASLTCIDCVLTYNLNAGFYADGGTHTFSGGEVAFNTGTGVYLTDAAGFAAGTLAAPKFDGVDVHDNAGPAMSIPANHAGEIGPLCAFTANDLGIVLRADTVERTQTWRAHAQPYRITGDVFVQGALNPVLTVAPGALLHPTATDVDVYVGWNDDGRIVTAGTAVAPVVFEPPSGTTPGAWGGFRFGTRDLGSTFTHTRISYAGGNGVGAIAQDGPSTLTLDAVEIHGSSTHGLRADPGTITLTNSALHDNLGSGLSLGASALIGTFAGNELRDNGATPATLPANVAGRLDVASTYGGNADPWIGVIADTVEVSQTWRAIEVPFRLLGDVFVQGTGDPRLTIDAGAVVELSGTQTDLYVGWNDDGRLDVLGSGATELRGTGGGSGEWGAVRFGTRNLGSTITGAVVTGGGAGAEGMLALSGGTLAVVGSVVQNSGRSGIYVDGGTVRVATSTLTSNTDDGLVITSGGRLDATVTPSFAGNTVTGNGGFALTLPSRDADQLDTSSTYAGNGGPVRLTASTVDRSGTWRGIDEQYLLTGDTFVQGVANPILTVGAGATLTFLATGDDLYVGWNDDGGLRVQGEALSPVRFASAASAPLGGAWGGITFGSRQLASSLTHAIVTHGGGNGNGNLYVTSSPGSPLTLDHVESAFSSGDGLAVVDSLVSITDCDFHDNAGYGADVDGTSVISGGNGGADLVASGNGAAAMRVPPEYAGTVDGATFDATGNATNAVEVIAGTVRTSQTWDDIGVPWRVTGDVFVQGAADPVLTVLAGTVVEFVGSATDLYVGWNDDGDLVTQAGVVLRGSVATRGSWGGITVGSRARNCVLTGTTVQWGGGNGQGALYIGGGASTKVTVTGSTVSGSSQRGIHVVDGEVAVSGSTLADNNDEGLSVTTGRISTVGAPSLAGNTLSDNGGFSATVPAAYADQLGPTSTYGGQPVRVLAGTVTRTGTWHALGVPMVLVTGDVFVQGAADPVLTVAAGAEVRFGDAQAELYVGWNDDGGLIVAGSALDDVTFTSNQGAPNPGDWGGVRFGSRTQRATLSGLTVEYAGGNGSGGITASGTRTPNPDTVVELFRVTVASNGGYGLRAEDSVVRARESWFLDNGSFGMSLDGTSLFGGAATPYFSANAFGGNTTRPLQIPAYAAGDLDAGSIYFEDPGDLVQLEGATVGTSQTWRLLDADYLVTGDVFVQGPADPDLELEPGVRLLFGGPAVELYVGWNDDGGLFAAGGGGALGDGDEVVFTSAQASPAKGDWGGLRFGTRCRSSALWDVNVEWGGGNGAGNVYTNACAVDLDGVRLAKSAAWGLQRQGAPFPTTSGILCDDNGAGCIQ